MSGESCPMPAGAQSPESGAIERMLAGKRIAVVGLSPDPQKPSHEVAAYLQEQGYTILPVNPGCESVLGERCSATLAQTPGPIDVALVFRRPEHAGQAAREAIAAGARGVWLQAGIRNEEARGAAQAAGVPFVQDRCMMVEHRARKRRG